MAYDANYFKRLERNHACLVDEIAPTFGAMIGRDVARTSVACSAHCDFTSPVLFAHDKPLEELNALNFGCGPVEANEMPRLTPIYRREITAQDNLTIFLSRQRPTSPTVEVRRGICQGQPLNLKFSIGERTRYRHCRPLSRLNPVVIGTFTFGAMPGNVAADLLPADTGLVMSPPAQLSKN